MDNMKNEGYFLLLALIKQKIRRKTKWARRKELVPRNTSAFNNFGFEKSTSGPRINSHAWRGFLKLRGDWAENWHISFARDR